MAGDETRGLVLAAKEELEYLNKIQRSAEISDNDVDKYNEVMGSTQRIYEMFIPLIKFLSFKLGYKFGMASDTESEGAATVVDGIRRFNSSIKTEDFHQSFIVFMNHRIRSDIMMFFLKNRNIVTVPRRILLVAAYYHKAISFDHNMTDVEVEAFSLGKDYFNSEEFAGWCSKNNLDLYKAKSEMMTNYDMACSKLNSAKISKADKDEVHLCQHKLGSLSRWKQRGAGAAIDLLRKAIALEDTTVGPIYDTSIRFENNIEDIVCFREMLSVIRKRFDQKTYEYWIKRRMGFSIQEMGAHKRPDGHPVSKAAISRRIRTVEKWIEENGEQFVEGTLDDDTIGHYLEAGGAS